MPAGTIRRATMAALTADAVAAIAAVSRVRRGRKDRKGHRDRKGPIFYPKPLDPLYIAHSSIVSGKTYRAPPTESDGMLNAVQPTEKQVRHFLPGLALFIAKRTRSPRIFTCAKS